RVAGRAARRVHRDPHDRAARRRRTPPGRRRDRRGVGPDRGARGVSAQACRARDGDRPGGGGLMANVLLIDNYDSFTYNLAHLFGELGAEVVVRRNDEVTVEQAEAMEPTHVVISPGPGRPEAAGV